MKIRAGKKVLLETFDHFILEMDADDFHVDDNVLTPVRIGKENMKDAGNAVGNTTGRWILNGDPHVEGYYFADQEGRQVGSCWVMWKGGDEKLYKVRKTDGFLFRLEVDEEHQGKGYSKMILDHMFRIIETHDLKKVTLVCAVKNEKALHLYESIGMKKTGRRIFIRVLDHNVPYYSL